MERPAAAGGPNWIFGFMGPSTPTAWAFLLEQLEAVSKVWWPPASITILEDITGPPATGAVCGWVNVIYRACNERCTYLRCCRPSGGVRSSRPNPRDDPPGDRSPGGFGGYREIHPAGPGNIDATVVDLALAFTAERVASAARSPTCSIHISRRRRDQKRIRFAQKQPPRYFHRTVIETLWASLSKVSTLSHPFSERRWTALLKAMARGLQRQPYKRISIERIRQQNARLRRISADRDLWGFPGGIRGPQFAPPWTWWRRSASTCQHRRLLRRAPTTPAATWPVNR